MQQLCVDNLSFHLHYCQVLAKVNERLGVQFIDKAQDLLAKNPQMAARVQKALEKFSGSVNRLPKALGYTVGEGEGPKLY